MIDGTHELAENKLLLLYIFEKMQYPISNAHITEIVLENNLLNYFHLQQYLGELVSSSFLKLDKEDRKQLYSISQKGRDVLEYFENRIDQSKKQIIITYLNTHTELIKQELQVNAEYFPSGDNGYTVTCRITENRKDIITLKINAKSNEQAKLICSKWKSDASNIYKNIISMLGQ